MTILLFTSSCTDPCESVNCANGGVCNEGTCACPDGFTGEFCQTNLCAAVNCGANGACVDGSCVCDQGYEGANCQTAWNTAAIGSYTCQESCTSGNYNNSSTVTAGTGAWQFSISNFGDYGVQMTCNMTSATAFTFDQTFTLAGMSVHIAGSGQLTATGMTFTYTFTEGGQSDTCTVTAVG